MWSAIQRAASSVWKWAGHVDDIYGRVAALLWVAALVGGGVLLILRSLGIVNTLLAIVGGLAVFVGLFFLAAYTTNAYAAHESWQAISRKVRSRDRHALRWRASAKQLR